MIGKVFDRIEGLRPVATKTEVRLIDGVKKIEKEDIIYMSITELASLLGVAEATFLRFCRKLDYRGFQDFKLNLSQELGSEKNEDDTGRAKRIADDMTDAIFETYKQLDYDDCIAVAKLIIGAGKCCVFGVGNSAVAPVMLKNKLVRAGIYVENTSDTHMQTIIASNLGKGDVILLVSVSGATKDIINLAEIAKKNGTAIVVITNYNRSPLAKYADYTFYTCRKEAAYEGGSLATVVAQSYIMDMLCSAVFELLGDESNKRSLKASNAVSDKSL